MNYHRIKIPLSDRNNFIDKAGHIPYSSMIEIGGYITNASIYYCYGNSTNVVVEPSHNVVFHTHPIGSLPVPSKQDILNFMFNLWKSSVLLTPLKLILMTKTIKSKKVLKDLDVIHRDNVIDVANLLEKTPDKVLDLLLKNYSFLPSGSWKDIWFKVVDMMKFDLSVWDCVKK
jgi:hypothetical protein